ncbi:MAG: thioesterase family protein [Sandaracinaceae bacterium]
MTAFYRPANGLFHSTPLTTGPWDLRAQHGGPPLTAPFGARRRAHRGGAFGFPTSRASRQELPRACPGRAARGPVRGREAGCRSAARLALALTHDARVVARATALCLRVRAAELEVPAEPSPETSPEASARFDFPFFRTEVGYHTAFDLRLARGTFGATPTFMWMRARVPLVEGEPLTGPQRVALSADSGNGVSPVLDWTRHDFINPDLTVALHRTARGEWIGLDARTIIEPALGVGMAQTRIWDLDGPVGCGIQSLLCNPRVIEP